MGLILILLIILLLFGGGYGWVNRGWYGGPSYAIAVILLIVLVFLVADHRFVFLGW